MTQMDTQQVLQKAMVDLREGRVQEAEVAYRDVLQRDPLNVDALTMLGMIAGQTGHAESAVKLFAKAVSVRPGEFRLYHNLAMALRQIGRFQEAIDAYRRGLDIREDISLLIPLANLYWLVGKGNDAEDMLLRALKLEPNSVTALHGIGSIYLQLGFHDRAAGALKRVVELNPSIPEALRDYGVALFQLNRFEESVEINRRALTTKADDIVALNHLGMALQRLGRHDEAQEYFSRVVALPAARPEEWFNRGLALTSLYQMEEAEAAYRESLRQQPRSVPALLNLGVACGLLGKSTEARQLFAESVRLAPHFDTARLHHAVALLHAGDFEVGWKEYQSRWKVPSHHEPPRPFTQPAWRDQRIDGKTVLIYGEQGFGDAIQFVRYAPMAAERGATVILEVRPELVSLLRTVKGVTDVVARGDTLPPFDYHAAILDLPLIFNTRLKNVPASVPYVFPDPSKIKQWSDRLAQDEPNGRPALRVGLAWSGSVTHLHDRSRSMNLSNFAPLVEAGADRVSFFNLQKGPRSEQAANTPAGMQLRDYTGDLNDFEDTAALMTNLDLVISVDTSVVHLAGALAKPVWTLIAIGPDWRWLAEREDSPWYPTMRLFRQTKWKDWAEVMQRVAAALREKLASQ